MTEVRSPRSKNLRSILWMLAGAFSFTVMGALTKQLVATLPIPVIVFFRMIISLVLLVPWILHAGAGSLATDRLWLHMLRGLAGAGAIACYAYAVGNLIFADAMALSYTTPLWMIIIAWMVLGEAAGLRRGVATIIGFAGVVVIARPHLEIDPAMVVALVSALLGSLSLVAAKTLAVRERVLTITFYFCLFVTLFSVVPTIILWRTPTMVEFVFLLGVGLTAVVGLACVTRAYSLADATLVAPLDFARLPLAVFIGLVFFDEMPDAWTVGGMLIIVASILYIARRDRHRKARETVDEEA